MGLLVVTGAQLMCPFGTAPGNFNATTKPTVQASGKPAGTVKDMAAMTNITPFGMCTSLANPQVAAATAAALGVLTPQPCMPAAAGTWTPVNPKVLIGGAPCLVTDAVCICANGMGTIQITNPGQTKVIV